MNQNYKIDIIHNNWNKTEFTTGISSPKPTEDITSAEYVDLVKDAIDIWQSVLTSYAKTHSESNHLSKIKFHVSESFTGSEDILFQWWFASIPNGFTKFIDVQNVERDMIFDEQRTIKKVNVFIGKYNNSIVNIPCMEDAEPYKGKVAFIKRNTDQIKSVALHEFGHVLGLGHCSYWKDMMITGTGNQPDPRRRISSINLQIISELFGSIGKPNRKQLIKTRSFFENEWIALH